VIVDLHKYLIYGNKNEMDQFFYLAQRAGFLEFIDFSRKRTSELPAIVKTFLAAIKIAKHYPTHPHEAPTDPIDEIAENIVTMREEQEVFLEEERILLSEIARIAAFGNFSRNDLILLEKETKRVFQFFCMKSEIAAEMTLPAELIFVGTEYDLDYFCSINKEHVQYPKMIEILIDHPVGELKIKLKHVREEIAKLEGEIKFFANSLFALQKGCTEHLDTHFLQKAKANASMNLGDSLFAIEAWVPATRKKSLLGLVSTMNVEYEEILIEKTDQIPTHIENKGSAKVGEDLLHIFDTPAHTDKDPSLWILIFFALFFSMIVSDAGYGLIFLAFSLFLKFKFPKLQGTKRRIVKLSIILSSCSIFWGVFTSSYFGLLISPASDLQKISVLNYLAEKKADYVIQHKDDIYETVIDTYPNAASATSGKELLMDASKKTKEGMTYPVFEEFSNNILMEFSFLIGIVHIGLSFCRYMRRNYAGIGWIIFMIGGYLYFPSIIQATTIVNFTGLIAKSTAYYWGIRLIIAGVSIAFILAFIKKRFGAFGELMHGVQVFADVLSYLRLYALALGGMVMAHTFNDALGVDPGFIFTVLIVFMGHVTNIAVALMGSVVHGLRLNFLEWFRYSFEGGGRLFNPLKLHKIK